MPNGEKRPIDFKEAEKIFCGHFPRRDIYEPPTEEGKSLPGLDSDSEAFDANPDDVRK